MGKVVLVVDDSWEVIETIAIGLKKINPSYQLINAANGLVAYEIATKKVPDIIIMDWDMPVMNGIDSLRQLKSDQRTVDVPVIVASGKMTTSENLNTALKAGAIDYIRKPIDFTELEARLNTALNIRKQQDDIKALMKKELELKNRKLSSTSVLLMERDKLLEKIATSIDELNKTEELSSKNKKNLKQLSKQIQEQIDLKSSWKSFRTYFDEVHSGFLSRIEEQYPDISLKDLRLCAYLKLGTDNKEIAKLLNITSASVSTAMYRLKKKLGLSEETDLRAFILKLD